MKPSILVVIFDFLVSSLLLFVIGAGTPSQITQLNRPAGESSLAGEFSPAAVAVMEAEWRASYDEQWKDLQLASKTEKNKQLFSTVEVLNKHLEQSKTENARRGKTIESLQSETQAKTEELGRLDGQLRETQQRREQLQASLRNTESDLQQSRGDSALLRQKKTELEGQLATSTTREKQLTEQGGQLQKQVAAMEQHKADLRKEVADKQTTIAGLQKQLGELIQRQSDISGQMKSQQAQTDKQFQAMAQTIKTQAKEIDRFLQAQTETLNNIQRTQTNISGLMRLQLTEADKRSREITQTVRVETEKLGSGLRKQDEKLAGIQSTTQATLQEVKQLQTALTEQSAILRRQQEGLKTSLGEMKAEIEKLPKEMKENFASMTNIQQRVVATASSLGEAAQLLRQTMTSQEGSNTVSSLMALAKEQREIQQGILAMAKASKGEVKSRDVEDVRARQKALEDKVAGLGRDLEGISTRMRGPFAAVCAARMEVAVAMTEKDTLSPDDHASWRVFSPVFNSKQGAFVAAHYSRIGLNWPEIINDNDLSEVSITIGRPPGENRWSEAFRDRLLALQEDPQVVLIPLPIGRANSQTAMPLIGRAGLQRRGTGELRLFKATTSGLSFEANASPNMADPRYLVLKGLSWTAKTFSPADAQAESGDFITTNEGSLIGIMVDERRCYVLDEAALGDIRFSLPVSSPIAFRDSARCLCKAVE
ncbi:MAG: hypothetical protein NTY01_07460 [Verrucomicrobia bacterium]|nr:hypothetical protein [Verrucomicrobiota bacterium]